MAEGLHLYCDMRARYAEGEELVRSASERFRPVGEDVPVQQWALYHLMLVCRARLMILGVLDSDNEHYRLLEEVGAAVAFFRTQPDRRSLAFALHIMGITYNLVYDHAKAEGCFQEAMALYTELGDDFAVAEALAWMGCTVLVHQCKPLFLRALELQRPIGDDNGLAWSLTHLARISFWERDYPQASRYLEEAISTQRGRGDLKGLNWSMNMGAQHAIRQGDFERAYTLTLESWELARLLNFPPLKQAAYGLRGLINIVLERDLEEGKRLCREALTMPVQRHQVIGDPYLDALTGLSLAAYHENDRPALHGYFRQALAAWEGVYDDEEMLRYTLVAVIAFVLLMIEERLEDALSLSAAITQQPERSDNPLVAALANVPLVQRLEAQLRQDIPPARYHHIWQHSAAMDVAAFMRECVLEIEPAHEPEAPALDSLTDREQQVLRLVADGLSNREIAERLVLATGTVKWYLSEIYSKLGVTSRTQALVRARQLHYLE
ncbi:MAG: response regulator transcription factor [bacterium]|nr:response regulator transcription factor [bacterium]